MNRGLRGTEVCSSRCSRKWGIVTGCRKRSESQLGDDVEMMWKEGCIHLGCHEGEHGLIVCRIGIMGNVYVWFGGEAGMM